MERNLSRICRCIGIYTRNSRLEHECQVGSEYVTYGGKMFASYFWVGDTDVPQFTFYDLKTRDRYCRRQSEEWAEAQFRKRPYIDDPTALMMIDYAIQQIQKLLTIWDAKTIKWVNDYHGGDWDKVSHNSEVDNIQKTIEQTALTSSHGYLTPDKAAWQHLANCAIY